MTICNQVMQVSPHIQDAVVAPILLSTTADTVTVTDESCSNFHGGIVRDRRANVRKVAHFQLIVQP